MNKTEAITILEAQGWRFKNTKRAQISVCDPGRDDWYQVTTEEIKQMADFMAVKQGQANEPEPINNETTTATIEQDIKSIAEAIKIACRFIVAIAVWFYVAGFTFGTWVHEANDWLVVLHRRRCKDRLEIVGGYIVSGYQTTSATLRGVVA